MVQAEAQLLARELELNRQKQRLEKLVTQIGNSKILAPADGLVIYATSVRSNRRGNAEPLDEGEQRPQARGEPQRDTHLQTTQISTAATRAAARGNGGFNTLGHFAQAVRAGISNPANMDGRLRAALSTYGNEGTGADGGFAVPADFRTEIMRLVQSEDSLFSRCDATPTAMIVAKAK